MMKRREFITMLGSAAAWPLWARAEPAPKKFRIGYLGLASAAAQLDRIQAMQAGLQALGYVEGANIIIEYRWAEGRYDRLSDLASELVQLNVDVIVTHATPGVLAVRKATASIPIVVAAVGDAVASGLVSSISRPGGNVTGLTFFNPELAAKRLELLKEALPRVTRAGILLNFANPMNQPILPAVEEIAGALNLDIIQFSAQEPAEFATAFAAMGEKGIGGLIILDDPVLITNADLLAKLAFQYRLPSVGPTEFGPSGGLLTYGVSFPDMWRRTAFYVDKILKGATPASLPVERPTKFMTIVNLKSAKALGIDIPTSLLLRADEVIE